MLGCLFKKMSTLWITSKESAELRHGDSLVLWSHYSNAINENEVFSVPKELDENFKGYKNKYLNWLSNLKTKKINDVSLLEVFKLRSDFSIWWMSLLVEKSQWKSPRLHDVFRLLTLHTYLQQIKVKIFFEVKLDVDDYELEMILQAWFEDNWPNTKVRATKRRPISFFYEKFRVCFQKKVKFLSYIVYQFFNGINGKPHTHPSLNESQISIFSYFFNVDKNKLKIGKFVSNYWGPLTDLLDEFDFSCNWHHIFVRRYLRGGQKKVKQCLSNINLKSTEKEYHCLLQSSLTLRVYLRALFDFFELRIKSHHVRGVDKFFVIDGGFNFWLLLKNDWYESFKGKVAFENCLTLNIFEKLLSDIAYQSLGLYLLENQAWERALVYSWKKFRHGQLIGVQHAAFAISDLRFYQHPSEYNNLENFKLPIPDFIGVNGNATSSLVKDSGFPAEQILELEALRYLYLNKISVTPKSTISAKSFVLEKCRLLVLGDYLPNVSERLMDFLHRSLDLFQFDTQIYIKSHPANPIDVNNWPKIKGVIIDDPISEIHNQYDIALCSSSSAACLDIYFAKKPVILLRDPEKINMSPLKNYPGARFITLPSELAEYLKYYDDISISETYNEAQEYFFLDEYLTNYRKILQAQSGVLN